MALQKSKTLSNGSSGDYWKIIEMSCDRQRMKCTFKIALFMSKDIAMARSGDLGIIKTFSFSATREQLAGDLAALGYALIKAKANEMVSRLGREDAPSDPDLANAVDA